jgi:hypothetical protein
MRMNWQHTWPAPKTSALRTIMEHAPLLVVRFMSGAISYFFDPTSLQTTLEFHRLVESEDDYNCRNQFYTAHCSSVAELSPSESAKPTQSNVASLK